MSGVAGRLALLVAATAAALLFAEAIVRWVAPQPLIQLRPDIWVPDRHGLGHRLAPDVDVTINTGEREVRILTNARGHRIGPESDRFVPRVLALGDSFLEALAVPHEQTVTARLSRALSEHTGSPVTVANTGVSGYGLSHYRIRAERELRHGGYEVALVFVFLRNDLRAHHRRRFLARPPTPEPRVRFPRALSREELFGAIVHPTYSQLRTRSQLVLLLKNRLLPVLADVGLVTDVEQASGLLALRAGDKEIVASAAACEEIAQLGKRRNVSTLFVLIPSDFQVDEELGRRYAASLGYPEGAPPDMSAVHRIFAEALQQRGLEFVDALPALRDAQRSGTATFGKVDRHLSPEGHAVLAAAVEPSLVRLYSEAAPTRSSNAPPRQAGASPTSAQRSSARP